MVKEEKFEKVSEWKFGWSYFIMFFLLFTSIMTLSDYYNSTLGGTPEIGMWSILFLCIVGIFAPVLDAKEHWIKIKD